MIFDDDLKREIEAKTVFVISSGEYSDYSICCVFSTEQKAKDFIGDKTDIYQIEKYILDNDTGNAKCFRCFFDKEGNGFVEEIELIYDHLNGKLNFSYYPHDKLPASSISDMTKLAGYYSFDLIARSKEQAYHFIGDIHTDVLINYKWGQKTKI